MRNTSATFVLWNIINLLCVEATVVLIQPNDTVDVNAVGKDTKFAEDGNRTQIEITGDVCSIDNGLLTKSNLPALLTLINTSYTNDDFKLFVGSDPPCDELIRYSVNGPAEMSEDGTKLVVDITLQDDEDGDNDD